LTYSIWLLIKISFFSNRKGNKKEDIKKYPFSYLQGFLFMHDGRAGLPVAKDA